MAWEMMRKKNAKFVIPVLLYYIVTLIVAANWEMGPGDTSVTMKGGGRESSG